MLNTFIPKPYKKEVISIRVDLDKLEIIDRLLAKHQMTRSEFINRCIDYALEHLEVELV